MEHSPIQALYYTLAIFTVILCLYVITSYIRNISYRKPPAGLMLSKTATDLLFSVIFFLMLLFVNNNAADNTFTHQCRVFGPIFIISFIASQTYFTAICWDLYRTLSNPFRQPAADSFKLHILVWVFSAILIATVAPFHVFRYREAYGICFSCDIGPALSGYNVILFYIPLTISNSSGVIVTIYAFKRLSNGLEKTFELRQQIIKRQLILVGFLAVLSLITVISMCTVIYGKSFRQSGTKSCDITADNEMYCLNPQVLKDCGERDVPDKPQVILSLLVFLNGGFDAVGWYLLQKLTQPREERVSKTINIDENQSLMSEHHDMDELNNSNHSSDQSKSMLPRTNDGSNEKEQNVSNALRGEIISYMTAGLARGIRNTAHMTYEKMYAYGDAYMEITFNDNDEDNIEMEDQTLEKNANGNISHSNENKNILFCEEPEPKRAQYPMHIHHDPKSYQGVINEMYIQLPTQNFLSMKVTMSATSNPSNCLNVNGNDNEHNIVSTTPLPHKKSQAQVIEEEEMDLLSSLDAKKQRNKSLTQSETINNFNMYESAGTDVELSATTNNIKNQKNKASMKLQQLNDDEPPFNRQTSTGSTAGMILESITRTVSLIANNNNIVQNTDSYNTVHTGYTMNDTIFGVDADEFKSSDNIAKGEMSKNGIPFKDYAPHVFRYLRQQIYEISDAEYLQSVRPPNFEEQNKLIQEKFSEGRSGAFFFFTHDSKFIIKTVTKQEASLLLKILPQFVTHYSTNPHTLINRFFGLHSITMYNLQLYFVVLENVFVAGSKPHEIYDIKGSFVDRHTNHHVESGKLMKDQDLHKTLKLMPISADNMFKQIKADSKFLCENNIMDYSVLLGIYYVGIDPSDVYNDRIMQNYHDSSGNNDGYLAPELKTETLNKNEESMEIMPKDLQTLRQLSDEENHISEHRPDAPSYQSGIAKFGNKDKAVKARVIEGPGIYYLGIIDVLQEWNTIKKLERFAKVYLRCKSKHGISCVEPNYYRKRFLRKMHRIGIRSLQSSNYPSNENLL